jgi:hypothetical protein
MLLLALVSFMMQKIPGQQVIWTDDTPTMLFDRNRRRLKETKCHWAR